MRQIPDDPIIARLLWDGVPEDEPPRCPVCGGECETVYKNEHGEIVGCDECLTAFDAYEESACIVKGGYEW